jgi:hypothetical protein
LRDVLNGAELTNDDEGHSMKGEKNSADHKTAKVNGDSRSD